MPVMIQLRNVPDDLHRKLKAQAAAEGLTLSAYILRDVKENAERPTREQWLEKVRKLRPIKGGPSSAALIRQMRDAR